MPPSWKKRPKTNTEDSIGSAELSREGKKPFDQNKIKYNDKEDQNRVQNQDQDVTDDSLEKIKEILEQAELESGGYKRKRELSKKEKFFKRLEKAAIWLTKTKLKFQGSENVDAHEIIDAAHELQPEISYEDLKNYYLTLENESESNEDILKSKFDEKKLKIIQELEKEEKEKFRRLISCIFSRSHLEEFLSVMEALGFNDLGGFEYLGRRDADYSLAMDWETQYRIHARVYLVKEEVFVLVHHEPKATEDISLHIKGYFDRITNALLEKEKKKQMGLIDEDSDDDEIDVESGSEGEEKVELSNYELGTEIFLKLLKKRVPNFYKKIKTKIEDTDLAIWKKFIGVIDHLSPEELLKENLYESSRYIPPFVQIRNTAMKMFAYFQLDAIPAWDDDVPASDKYFIATNETFLDDSGCSDTDFDDISVNNITDKGNKDAGGSKSSKNAKRNKGGKVKHFSLSSARSGLQTLKSKGKELSNMYLTKKRIRASKLSRLGVIKPANQLSVLVLTEDISDDILRTIGILKGKYNPDFVVLIAPDISLFGPEEDDIPPEGIEIPPFDKNHADELVSFLTDSEVTIIPVSLFIRLFDINLKTPLTYNHLKLLFSNRGLLSESHIQEILNKFDYIDDYIKNAEKMLEVIKALPKYRWVSFWKLKRYLKKEGLGLSAPELLGLLGIMESPLIDLIESRRVSWIRYRTRAKISEDEWYDKKEQLKQLLQNFLTNAV